MEEGAIHSLSKEVLGRKSKKDNRSFKTTEAQEGKKRAILATTNFEGRRLL